MRGNLPPKICPGLAFPEWPAGDAGTGQVALGEWPLPGAWIASLNAPVWAGLPSAVISPRMAALTD